MLKKIKRGTLDLSRSVGFFDVASRSRWRRQRLLILCYHGISALDEHLWDPRLFMNAAAFEARLEMLSQGGYVVLPLGEALERLYGESLPGRSVAITIDDGTHGVYHHALPLLRRFGFPATVYLTTYYSDHNWPVFNLICSYILWRRRGTTVDLRGIPGLNQIVSLPANDTEIHRRLQAALVRYVRDKSMSTSAKIEIAERIAERAGVDFGELKAKRILHLMNPQEVAEISSAGLDVELHTHRHRVPLDRDLFHREIEDNRRRIVEITGRIPVHFCYPSGVTHPRFLSYLVEQNIVSATTCEVGFATSRSNPLLLPRLTDHTGLAPVEIESWLTGVGTFLPRKRVERPAA